MLIPVDKLRRTYSPGNLSGLTSSLPAYQKGVIGQERAVRALKFGLGNRAPGFNVYVCTPHGDEKISVIKHFLKALASQDPVPEDWVYVNNFEDNYCPRIMRLPQGTAKTFKQDIERFIYDARSALIKSLESEEYARQQGQIKQQLGEKQKKIFSRLQEEADKLQFIVKTTPVEISAYPKVGDKAMTREQFEALEKEERETIRAKQDIFQKILSATIRKTREVEKDATEALLELERKAALFAIEGLVDEVQKKYLHIEGVQKYLDDMKQHLLANLVDFLQSTSTPNQPGGMSSYQVDHVYQVNILVDNSGIDHAPIVVEYNPTFNNLFGKIERESVMGTLVTDFTLIKPGALHRANGGYLIIPVEDLLTAPFSYEHLKRSLRNQHIFIEDPTERYGFITAKSLKPEPTPLNLQVILIGKDYLLQMLYQYDDDFKDLFKVKADFDSVMPAIESNIRDLCGYIQTLTAEENLLSLTDPAMARMMEFSHRRAEHQEKLTTQIEDIADLIREANYYARQQLSDNIDAQHIHQAIEEKRYRSSLLQEKISELIRNGTIRIDLEGGKIGEINGLSVLDLGDWAFGKPSKITATISVGNNGVLDIEREVKMGGPIHSKGVLILSGLLYEKFGKDKPLNASMQLVFEQNYFEVEGDSASAAELYALLSSIADVPLKQSIAVTGSVNQKGQIQAVGGINEKIEGYFEVCRQCDIQGDPGVIIPSSNLKNLMLREDVVDAVKKKQFKIWSIDNIDEGIEILTGLKAGEITWDKQNNMQVYEPNSFYSLVNLRLEQMSETLKDYLHPMDAELMGEQETAS